MARYGNLSRPEKGPFSEMNSDHNIDLRISLRSSSSAFNPLTSFSYKPLNPNILAFISPERPWLQGDSIGNGMEIAA